MTVTVAFLNSKGGVAKTTSAVNLATGLARTKRDNRVLLVDCDLQGNSTEYLGVSRYEREFYLPHWLIGATEFNVALCKSHEVYVLPNSLKAKSAYYELKASTETNEQLFANKFSEIEKYFDFMIFDCPPGFDFVVTKVINYVDCFIIPLQLEPFAVYGLDDVINALEGKKRPIGILFVMVTNRFVVNKGMKRAMVQKLNKDLKNPYIYQFQTEIPRSVTVPLSQWDRVPIILKEVSPVGEAYQKLIAEFKGDFLKQKGWS